MVGYASFVNIKVVPPKYVNYSHLMYKFRKSVPSTYGYAKPEYPNCCFTKNFLKYNSMPGEIEEVDGLFCTLSVNFPEHLPIKVCEDVYQTLIFWKPVGVSLVTNRNDLFIKLKEASTRMDELLAKKHKLCNKLEKVDRKIEELIKEVEV